jgi:hypothetical protein
MALGVFVSTQGVQEAILKALQNRWCQWAAVLVGCIFILGYGAEYIADKYLGISNKFAEHEQRREEAQRNTSNDISRVKGAAEKVVLQIVARQEALAMEIAELKAQLALIEGGNSVAVKVKELGDKAVKGRDVESLETEIKSTFDAVDIKK